MKIEQLRELERAATAGPWHLRNEDRPDPHSAPMRYRIQNQPGVWDKHQPNPDGTTGEWDCINIAEYEAIALTFCGTARHTALANAQMICEMRSSLSDLLKVAEAAKAYCVLSHAGQDTHDAYLDLWKALEELEAK
jgi:hypothetical protein